LAPILSATSHAINCSRDCRGMDATNRYDSSLKRS
jgi:hypothetical protein